MHKEGINKGREFYGCPQGIGSTCKLFKWADEIDDHGGGAGGRIAKLPRDGGSGSGGGRGTAQSRSLSRAGNPGKRKCGMCGEEGVTSEFFLQLTNLSSFNVKLTVTCSDLDVRF